MTKQTDIAIDPITGLNIRPTTMKDCVAERSAEYIAGLGENFRILSNLLTQADMGQITYREAAFKMLSELETVRFHADYHLRDLARSIASVDADRDTY